MDVATCLKLAVLDSLFIVELFTLKNQLDHCYLNTFFLLQSLLNRSHCVWRFEIKMHFCATKCFNYKLHILNYKTKSLPASSYVLFVLHYYFFFNLLRVKKTLEGLNTYVRSLFKVNSWGRNFFDGLRGPHRRLAIKFDTLTLRSRRFSRLVILNLVKLLSQVFRLVPRIIYLVFSSGRSLRS